MRTRYWFASRPYLITKQLLDLPFVDGSSFALKHLVESKAIELLCIFGLLLQVVPSPF